MALKYSLMQRVNPRDVTAARKFYAVAVSKDKVDLRTLSTEISKISTVSSIDTMAVLESLIQVIPEYLLEGRTIKLGEFGTFRLTISSDGADTAESFTSSMIKKVKLNFRPGKLISDALKTISYEKA